MYTIVSCFHSANDLAQGLTYAIGTGANPELSVLFCWLVLVKLTQTAAPGVAVSILWQ